MSSRDRDPFFSPPQVAAVVLAVTAFVFCIAVLILTEANPLGMGATAAAMVFVVIGQVSSARHVRRQRR